MVEPGVRGTERKAKGQPLRVNLSPSPGSQENKACGPRGWRGFREGRVIGRAPQGEIWVLRVERAQWTPQDFSLLPHF